MSAAALQVEQKPVTRLSMAIARCVRDFYLERMGRRGDPDRTIAHEVLNALAINVAVVLAGTGDDPQARAFFELALQQNLRVNIDAGDPPQRH